MRIKRALRNNSGSSLIEFLIGSAVFVPIIVGLLGFSYHSFAKVFSSWRAQQTLVCALIPKNRFQCGESFKEDIQQFLPLSTLSDFRLYKNFSFLKTSFKLSHLNTLEQLEEFSLPDQPSLEKLGIDR